MSLTVLAKKVADAIQASSQLEVLATELLTEIGDIPRPVSIDIGAGTYLICMHGWNSLQPASAFVHISDVVA